MYILVNEKNNTGYKGKRLTNENINSYPERILKLLEKSKVIKFKKVKPNQKEEK